MADDLGLLLDTVALQFPTRLKGVVVAAPRVAVEQQVPLALGLRLPNVSQLVDQQPLPHRIDGREVVAINFAKRMKMQVSTRRHGDAARLEREELAAADRDLGIVDRIAEYAAGQGDLALGKPALAADRTGERRFRQRSSPAARTSAGTVRVSPPTNVTVTSALLPAVTVSARFIAMTCWPPGSKVTV